MDNLIVLNVNKITELHELTKILYIYDFKLFINSDYCQKKKKSIQFNIVLCFLRSFVFINSNSNIFDRQKKNYRL